MHSCKLLHLYLKDSLTTFPEEYLPQWTNGGSYPETSVTGILMHNQILISTACLGFPTSEKRAYKDFSKRMQTSGRCGGNLDIVVYSKNLNNLLCLPTEPYSAKIERLVCLHLGYCTTDVPWCGCDIAMVWLCHDNPNFKRGRKSSMAKRGVHPTDNLHTKQWQPPTKVRKRFAPTLS